MTNIPKLNGFKESMLETFLAVPEAKMFPSNAGDVGAIPGQGGEVQHALWPENQITKRKQRVANSIQTLKMVHIKILFKKMSINFCITQPELNH